MSSTTEATGHTWPAPPSLGIPSVDSEAAVPLPASEQSREDNEDKRARGDQRDASQRGIGHHDAIYFVIDDAEADAQDERASTRTAGQNDSQSRSSAANETGTITVSAFNGMRPSEVAASMMAFQEQNNDTIGSSAGNSPEIELTEVSAHSKASSSNAASASRKSRAKTKAGLSLQSYVKDSVFSRSALRAKTFAAYSHLRESDFPEEVYGRMNDDDEDLDSLPLPIPKDSKVQESKERDADGRLRYLPGSAEAQDIEERKRSTNSGVRSWTRFLQGWGVLQESDEEQDGEQGDTEADDPEDQWEGYLFDFDSESNAEKSDQGRGQPRDNKETHSDDEDDNGMNDREVDNTLDTFPHTLSPEERARYHNNLRSVEPTIDVVSIPGSPEGSVSILDTHGENSRRSARQRVGGSQTSASSLWNSRNLLRIRQFCAFFGMSILIAVGYMDPGNWETSLDAGSTFRYRLLWAVLASSLLGYLFQYLSVKLGVATDRDLARMCRAVYSRRTNFFLWVSAEIGIIATDVASIIGAAIALRMLASIPLLLGIIITMFDVLIILFLQGKRQRILEGIVGFFALVIFISFCIQLSYVHASAGDVLSGFIPSFDTFSDSRELVLTIGILGATVMPHNLYLHSALVQTRRYPRTPQGRALAVRLSSIDSGISLTAACFVNVAILILSAAAFHKAGPNKDPPATLEQAQSLLSAALGERAAGVLFALALVLSGQASTVTSTLTGQFVMEGFLDLRLKPWVRRLATRLVAIVPAVLILFIVGENALDELIVMSQVVLSIQLSFAIIPLVWMTSNEELMGVLVNSRRTKYLAYFATSLVVVLNVYLMIRFFVLGTR